MLSRHSSASVCVFTVDVELEGNITSEVIDAKMLIDQQYYSIASKATILKPH
jgi:hypothetical protein